MKLQEDVSWPGLPKYRGEFDFTVQASDDAKPSRSASKTFKLSVSAQGPAIITSKSGLPWGRVGTDYQVKFTAWGGLNPYAWRSPDALPPGLKLQYDGMLSGKPAQAGDFGFTVQVSDLRQSSSRKFSVHISPAQTDPFGGATALASPRGASGGWRIEKIGKRWVFITGRQCFLDDRHLGSPRRHPRGRARGQLRPENRGKVWKPADPIPASKPAVAIVGVRTWWGPGVTAWRCRSTPSRSGAGPNR